MPLGLMQVHMCVLGTLSSGGGTEAAPHLDCSKPLSSTSGVTCEPQLSMSEMKISSGVAGGLYSSVLHCCEAVAGPVHTVPELDFCRKQTCVLLNTRDWGMRREGEVWTWISKGSARY